MTSPARSDDPGFRKKWLTLGDNRFAAAATVCTGVSVLATVAVGVLFIADASAFWRIFAVIVGIIASLAAWALKNRQRFEAESRELADTDGLITTLDGVLAQLPDAAGADPDSKEARMYVERVIDGLRTRLMPDGKRGVVRVCVFRRDEQEALLGKNGEEGQEHDPAGDVVSVFVRYVFDRGQRTDKPRRSFTDAKEPGATFMPQLFEQGRFIASSPEEFPSDPDHYSDGASPKYRSFVNLALTDHDHEAHAMLTCDATEENFFDARREQTIRAFSRLVNVALTRGSTRADVNRPTELSN